MSIGQHSVGKRAAPYRDFGTTAHGTPRERGESRLGNGLMTIAGPPRRDDSDSRLSAEPPIWFLDDDGIIVDRQLPGARAPIQSRRFGTVTAHFGILEKPIEFVFSKVAVEFVNRASARYEVQWLCQLNRVMSRGLAPMMGLRPFPEAEQYDFESTTDRRQPADGAAYWKAQVIRNTIGATGRRFLWTDDQLTQRVVNRMAVDFPAPQSRLVPVQHGSPLGLAEFDRIAEFVDAGRA